MLSEAEIVLLFRAHTSVAPIALAAYTEPELVANEAPGEDWDIHVWTREGHSRAPRAKCKALRSTQELGG
jgi:hypothetical protein